MIATEPDRDENPRLLAALVTALPVALAVLFVMLSCHRDVRSAATAPRPGAVAEPNPHVHVARTP